MATRRRGGGTTTTQTIGQDHHIHGWIAQSPLTLIVLILISGGAFFIFSQLQITSTEQTVFDILQVSTQLVPGMTGAQAQQFLNGNLNHYQTIAGAIGWSVQIALFLLSFPPEMALLSMHRRFNRDISASISQTAITYDQMRTFVMRILIGGDILTDFYYVAQGHQLVTSTWLGFIPSGFGPNFLGILIIGVIYPIAVCFITIFVGKYLLLFVEALIGHFRGA